MRIALTAIVVAVLMVNGEKPKAKANADADAANPGQPQQQTVTVVNQQTPQREQGDHAQKSPSYLSRLFSPENLPNITLVIVAGITALFILGQAKEMKAATDVMRGQLTAMQGQLVQMDSSGKQTDKLIKHASDQVAALNQAAGSMQDSAEAGKMGAAATLKAAIAAKESADATRESVEMFISKERARLRIDLKPLVLPPKPEPAYTVDFTVSIHGPTAAFINESSCVAYIFPWEVVDEPELGVAIMFAIHPLPSVIPANSPPLDCYAFLSLNSSDKVLIDEAKAGRSFIGIRGFIKYKDVFDRERITAFRYIWKYAEAMHGLGEEEDGDWVQRGKPEENQET